VGNKICLADVSNKWAIEISPHMSGNGLIWASYETTGLLLTNNVDIR